MPRVRPTEAAETVAVAQITGLVGRGPAGGPAPLVVRDAGHALLTLTLGLAETGATLLVRIRSDRSCDAAPPPPPSSLGYATPAEYATRARKPAIA